MLLVDGQGADLWREADDAEKTAWEANPPKPTDPDDDLTKFAEISGHPTLPGALPRPNRQTGYYEFNGINDLTRDDMIAILVAGRIWNDNTTAVYDDGRMRTNLQPHTHGVNGKNWFNYIYTFANNPRLEVANVFRMGAGIGTFKKCVKLRAVIGSHIEVHDKWDEECFLQCAALEEIRVAFGASASTSVNVLWLGDSPRLSLASVSHLATASTKPGTAHFHPDVYAKLTGDTTNAACAALTEEERKRWAGVMELAVANSQVFTTG